MGTHPNVILLLTLTPEDLSRKTMAAILAETNTDSEDDVEIGDDKYHHEIMESDYEELWQITAKAGDLIFFDFVTYGYGEQILWEKLVARVSTLEEWAKGICGRHHCSYKLSVTANYW